MRIDSMYRTEFHAHTRARARATGHAQKYTGTQRERTHAHTCVRSPSFISADFSLACVNIHIVPGASNNAERYVYSLLALDELQHRGRRVSLPRADAGTVRRRRVIEE